MADSMQYPYHQQVLTPTPGMDAYYHMPNGRTIYVPAPLEVNPIGQPKRPKYTRSKTGCLTCRVKKVKCDEAKPSCQRCVHGRRECTWPEPTSSRDKRKKSKADASDDRMSDRLSAGDWSDRHSSTSSPSPRVDAAQGQVATAGQQPTAYSDDYNRLPPILGGPGLSRRSSGSSASSGMVAPAHVHGYPAQPPPEQPLGAIPEIQYSYHDYYRTNPPPAQYAAPQAAAMPGPFIPRAGHHSPPQHYPHPTAVQNMPNAHWSASTHSVPQYGGPDAYLPDGREYMAHPSTGHPRTRY